MTNVNFRTGKLYSVKFWNRGTQLYLATSNELTGLYESVSNHGRIDIITPGEVVMLLPSEKSHLYDKEVWCLVLYGERIYFVEREHLSET